MGNYGLWDQLLAIRWVKENIEWFRGDPNRITLMGESAGAASVGLHTVSPASRGQDLFHQVIMISGSDLSGWAVTEPDRVRSRYYAIELGRALGCPSVQGEQVAAAQAAMRGQTWVPPPPSEVREGQFGNGSVKPRLFVPYSARIDAPALMRCLRYQKTAKEILDFSYPTPLNGAPYFIWTPVVDGTAGFLPRIPLEERKQGRFDPVPILAGVTHDEGSQVLITHLSPKRIPHVHAADGWQPQIIFHAVHFARNICRSLISDYVINSPLDAVLRFHAAFSTQTYFYEFAYLSPNDSRRTPERGVYHGAEQPFLLGLPFLDSEFWKRYYTGSNFSGYAKRTYAYPHDTNVSEFMMEAWTNFAKYGNPTPTPIKNVTWPSFKHPWEAYLFISLNSTPKFHFRSERMAFWRERFLKLAEPLSPFPPIYYFPLFDAQLATLVLGLLLFLILALLVVMLVLLCRRPRPDQFRHSVRLAPPGAAPGSAFQTAFADAFTTHSAASPLCPSVARSGSHPRPMERGDFLINQQTYESESCDVVGVPLPGVTGVKSTRRVHPPPPPPPTLTGSYSGRINQRRGSRSTIDPEHYSLESLRVFGQSVDI
ncbi:unnamed protein product [Echinostoma caproni]|uniref:Carboxylic ester hydrolase n=1 Tax=Echinostoma caproni TaxID=27848 RepID=A0A183AE94_9TREM|nr:unnamed protein product [Echinostoma caproni]